MTTMAIRQFVKMATRKTERLLAHRLGGVSSMLFVLASSYVKEYKNLNYDMTSNGELLMLTRLAKSPMTTVFDVGANIGDYSAACLEHMTGATIHGFEIAPPTFKRLSNNFDSNERIKIHNVGLSDANGEVQVFYNAADDGSTSSIPHVSAIYPDKYEVITCPVMTGDDYCEHNKIETIDLLKIDVEGAEDRVLNGFSRMLKSGAISCVQFEYGLLNIYTKVLLIDFWRLFVAYGYELGAITPYGVDFREYDPRLEDFQGCPNYLAVKKDRPDLIQCLRG